MELIAWWDDESDDPTTVRTPDELDELLSSAQQLGYPVLLELRDAAGVHQGLLTVGLNGDRGALYYSSDGQMAFSLNTGESLPAERTLYYYMGSDCEYPRSAEHSAAVIRQAAHEFMQSDGVRPSAVEWQPSSIMDSLPPYVEPSLP